VPVLRDRPAIGQVVHYTSHGTPIREDGSQAFPTRCRAALISEVENATHVGLVVLNPTGQFFHSLADGGSFYIGKNGPGYDLLSMTYPGGTWHWSDECGR
jgi:hypothetical protein